MSEYQHEDKKEYIIADGKRWRVWNNGIVENFSIWTEIWTEQNLYLTREDRFKFLKLWEKAEIGERYNFDWNSIVPGIDVVQFLGFREEQCPECKQSYMVWENKIQLCKGCDYIHAVQYDDS